MATTCGYVCPQCEGTGLHPETQLNCDYCSKPNNIETTSSLQISDEAWLNSVHNNCPCGNFEFEKDSVSNK